MIAVSAKEMELNAIKKKVHTTNKVGLLDIKKLLLYHEVLEIYVSMKKMLLKTIFVLEACLKKTCF